MKAKFILFSFLLAAFTSNARAQCSTLTPNYSLQMPTVGQLSWGGCLNFDLAQIDSILKSLTPSSLNNIIFVDGVKYSHTDIGAGINAAYAAASRGSIIYVPANPSGGCYATSTPIVFNAVNKEVTLRGAGIPSGSSAGTCIDYTPTTSTAAITIDWTPSSGGSFTPGGGVQDLMLSNNHCTSNGGCGSSAIGINIGPSYGGAADGLFSNLKIFGFGTGIAVPDSGNQSWGMVFDRVTLTMNTTGYSQPKTEELNTFYAPKIMLNGTGMNFNGGGDVEIFGGSIDSDSACGVQTNSATPQLSFFGTHWENLNVSGAPKYVCGGLATVNMYGGEALDDNSSSSGSGWFSASTFMVHGLNVFSAGESLSNYLFTVNGEANITVFDNSITPLPVQTIAFLGTGTCVNITGVGVPPFNACGALTVSSLPSPSTFRGQWKVVSDSTTLSSEGQACVGGSTNTALAFSNGSVWKCF